MSDEPATTSTPGGKPPPSDPSAPTWETVCMVEDYDLTEKLCLPGEGWLYRTTRMPPGPSSEPLMMAVVFVADSSASPSHRR